jgi:hypothetical protein
MTVARNLGHETASARCIATLPSMRSIVAKVTLGNGENLAKT